MTIHLVYAKGLRTSAPQAITNELAARLRAVGEVRVYDLGEVRTIVPLPGDILIGHPHHDPRTVFWASFFQAGWKKRIVMCPFSHGMVELNGWMEPVVAEADAFLAITGKPWFETMGETVFAHWKPKTTRLDLAVNRAHFPAVKKGWNAAGKRRFLYIGFAGEAKGTDYLAAIAEANPGVHFGWIGGGVIGTGAIEVHGMCDFHLPEARELVGAYDFVISCGRSDANPTTLLEGLAWGLVPVCTRGAGYWGEEWLVNIPMGDVAGASAVLRGLNECAEGVLDEYVGAGRRALEEHYTWDRFGAEVVRVVEGESAREPGGGLAGAGGRESGPVGEMMGN